MDEFYLDLINQRKELEISKIKQCNQISIKYGLTLSDEQIENIIQRRIDTLKDIKRIEFKESVIDKIIKEFCDSSYIFQDNYAQTLYELIEIFYEYKNETMDLLSDDELIKFMKKSFDGICQGDLDYLSGTVMYEMKNNVLNGKSLDNTEKEGESFEGY